MLKDPVCQRNVSAKIKTFKHCSKFPTRVETMISLQWRLWRWRTSSWTGVPSFSIWSHFKHYHPDGQVQRCLSLRPQPSTTCGGRPLNCIEGCQVNAFRWWTPTILMRRCSRSVQLTGHISSPRDLFRWFYLTKKNYPTFSILFCYWVFSGYHGPLLEYGLATTK